MKRLNTLGSVTICFLLFAGCTSMPAPKASEIQPHQNQPDTSESTDSSTTAAKPIGTVSNDLPDEITAPESIAENGPAVEKSPVSDVSEEDQIPEEIPGPPSVPDSEKILYFYPEPDALPEIPQQNEPLMQTAEIAPAQEAAPSIQQNTNPPVVSEFSADIPIHTDEVQPNSSKKSSAENMGRNNIGEAETDASSKDNTVTTPKTETEKARETMPGIWNSETMSPSISAKDTEREKPPLVPSRTVNVAPDQLLEVWYPGSGWVYLGDVSSGNGVGYQTRKLDGQDTLFTFKALKEGSYILKFSRFDVLKDEFAADALLVKVSDAAQKVGDKIRAPDYRGTTEVESVKETTETKTPENTVQTAEPAVVSSIADEPVLQTGAAVQNIQPQTNESTNPDSLLSKIQTALDSGDAVTALDLLDTYFKVAVKSLDEGWFLRGQAYETNGSARNIRKALAAYETLVTAYPDSSHWKDADARIRYIRKFYLGIQ